MGLSTRVCVGSGVLKLMVMAIVLVGDSLFFFFPETVRVVRDR